MTTVTRTAGAAGSITLTTKNTGGQLITPVSTPTVTWYTDSGRTLGSLALSMSGAGSSYTALWTGAQAPATTSTRYLKVSIETAAGVFSIDADDDVLFLAAGSSIASTDYTTLAAVKADLGIDSGDTTDDAAIATSITAASRAIDLATGTTFYPVTEARQFMAGNDGTVWVDRFTSTAGLAVTTGTDGTYPTTVAAASYVLWPYNAPSRGMAYQRMDFTAATYAYPLPLVYGRPTVQVTAAWGWHFIPADVERAARLKAARLFRRKDSPEGIAGTSEFGVVRVSDQDPDVRMLLSPYIEFGIA